MIVVDASAVVHYLLTPAQARAAGIDLLDMQEPAAPQVIDIEVSNALRRGEASRRLDAQRACEAFEDYLDLPILRFAHGPLLARIWQLRANLTAYDAAYVALAETLGCPLITSDKKMQRAPGHGATIVLVQP